MTVLLIVLAIIVIVLIIPFGVSAAYNADVFTLAARAAGLEFRLFPKKPKKERLKKARKAKAKKPKKPRKRRPEDDPEARKKEKLEKLFRFAKVGLEAMGRFRKKLTVNRLMLHVVLASDDPYAAAILYGGVNSALPALMAIAEQTLNIRDSDIRTEVSFESTEPVIAFEITLTISLARILGIVLAAAYAYAKLTIHARREKRREMLAEERTDRDGTAEPNV